MRLPVWLLISPIICLGVVVLTSFVIFLAVRRGTQAVRQCVQDEADTDASSQADSRWSRTDLAERNQPEDVIEKAACPACGGENLLGAAACTYCGRKL